MPKGQFRKGNDVRRKDPREAAKTAGRPKRAFSDRCKDYIDATGWNTLTQLAERGRQERTRLEALKFIVEHGYGKAPQPVTGEGGGPVHIRVSYADH